MSSQTKKLARPTFDRNRAERLDLLHPAGAFAHPADVLRDPDLTFNEKRAILASWASDACATVAAPALRQAPSTARPVSFDDIMDALRVLDRQAGDYQSPPRYRRVLAHRKPGVFGRGSRHRADSPGGEGQPLN
jgi:hypothetical protein